MIFRTIQALFLIAVGIVGIYEFYPLGRFSLALSKSQSAQTEGTVVEIASEGRNHNRQLVSRTVRVAFTAGSGRQDYLTKDLYNDTARATHIGQKQLVRYDPRDPGNNDLGKVGELFYYVLGVYVVTGGFVIAGLVMLLRMHNNSMHKWPSARGE
jgi:hypothetical protein